MKRLLGLFVVLPSLSTAFLAPQSSSRRHVECSHTRLHQSADHAGEINTPMDRRQLLVSTTGIVALAFPGAAIAATAKGGIGSDPTHPIVVIGAGGKCGQKCVQVLSRMGVYTRAVTRNGRDVLDGELSKYVTCAAGDVTDYTAIKDAICGGSAAIFAASASGKGGSPAQVDYNGLVNVAKACLECDVSKLGVISSATVTRPNSAGFKTTNFFVKYIYGDRIMNYKIAGESVMRDLYAKKGRNGYVVLRPGGLSENPPKGSACLHLSQGDLYNSEISRDDVAEVLVAAVLAGSRTDATTFELNSIENLAKTEKNLPSAGPKLFRSGSVTYSALLDDLLTDVEMKKQFSSVVSTFRGDVEPVDQVA